MITISLCMIVKNEEAVLDRCLRCASSLVDEIIIVDTGSIDRTKEIAAIYTTNIYDFEWIDDFSAARNFAFSKATKEYCMWLDADDIIKPEDQEKLMSLKQTVSPDIDVIMCRYHTAFDAQGNPTFYYYRERIVRNSKDYRWNGAIHEAISPIGHIMHSDFAVTHQKEHVSDPDRNLRIFEKLIAADAPLSAREHYYYARELYYHSRWEEAVVWFQTFLSMPDSWVENKIEACQLLSFCYENLANDDLALAILLQSMSYDSPRAEICCEIGRQFCKRNDYRTAIFWYELAASFTPDQEAHGFIITDCYKYIPYMQLCVCYDKLGNINKAIACNEKAGALKPEDPAYLYNKNYFANQLKSEPI